MDIQGYPEDGKNQCARLTVTGSRYSRQRLHPGQVPQGPG